MGFEWQHVKFSTLQPPWSRGQFNFDGIYTDIPNNAKGNTGRAQFLLTPIASTVPGGVDFVGGSNQVFVSNISLTDNGKDYYGGYVQDDWKLTPKLTLNLGVRYDFLGSWESTTKIRLTSCLPGRLQAAHVHYSARQELRQSFLQLSKPAGQGWNWSRCYKQVRARPWQVAENQFCSRVGVAYQVSPKLVARVDLAFSTMVLRTVASRPTSGKITPSNSISRSPTLTLITDYVPRFATTAGPGGSATFETGFSCTPLDPLLVNASGLQLRGIQFDYVTPYAMSGNLTVQYQLTSSMSVQAGYVTSLARHLEVFPNNNTVTSLADVNVDPKTLVSFPDFGRNGSQAHTEGNSVYHGLQTKLEKQFKGGLNFLATYTWSQARSDAHDLLNGGKRRQPRVQQCERLPSSRRSRFRNSG